MTALAFVVDRHTQAYRDDQAQLATTLNAMVEAFQKNHSDILEALDLQGTQMTDAISALRDVGRTMSSL